MTNVEGDAVDAGWQPLPLRARKLFVLTGVGIGLLVALPVFGLASGITESAAWAALAAALPGAAFGAWRGDRMWRYTAWRLDEAGFTLRRGHLWQRETRVPQSRVQHLDLRRGPLQRRYDLSTVVIHTAGTRQSAVTISGLDAGDAERLRDALARQVDDE